MKGARQGGEGSRENEAQGAALGNGIGRERVSQPSGSALSKGGIGGVV